MKHITAEALIRDSISRVSPRSAKILRAGTGPGLSPTPGRMFLTPDDICQIRTRYDQQTIHSGWYGFSLIGTPPAQVIAVIAFTSFGDHDHLVVARIEDGSYTVALDDDTVLATSTRLDVLLDLFDERAPHR